MISFMDRVSIGNARLYFMEDDLGMENDDYLLAVSVLFITYCVRTLFLHIQTRVNIRSSSRRPQTLC